LLRHIAERKFQIPRTIDILLCEQEVEASEKTPFDVVLSSDEVRNAYVLEEARLMKAIEDNVPDVPGKKPNTELLSEVYVNLEACGAAAAPGR
jgi:ribosomal protein L7/L12